MILHAEDIEKSFGSVAVLSGISLRVEPGKAIAIMGKSGAGKSTLLAILGLLERPTSGGVAICGHKPTFHETARMRSRHVGFVFQFHHLLEEETALQNVLLPARIARARVHPESPAYKRAQNLLDAMGLTVHSHTRAGLLSGGEKQRVAIARALCNAPDLILADEPSGNLDRATSDGIHALLLDICRKEHKALVVATHDAELAKLCDAVYLLENGKLISI